MATCQETQTRFQGHKEPFPSSRYWPFCPQTTDTRFRFIIIYSYKKIHHACTVTDNIQSELHLEVHNRAGFFLYHLQDKETKE